MFSNFNVGGAAPANTSPASGGGGEQSPEDIPREELMHLCMKLNTRMKTMEGKLKEVTKKKSSLGVERQKLLALLESTLRTSFNTTTEQDLDLVTIESTWQSWESQQRNHVIDLENQLKTLQLLQQSGQNQGVNSKSQDSPAKSVPGIVPESAANTDIEQLYQGLQKDHQDVLSRQIRLQQEVERLQAVEIFLQKQVKAAEQAIVEKNTALEQAERDREGTKQHLEERVVYLQMQQDALTSKVKVLSNQREEKEMLLENNKEMIIALQARLMEVEPDLVHSREKIQDLERHLAASKILKMEQDTLLASMQQDLKKVVEEKEDLWTKYQENEELKYKTEKQQHKTSLLQEEINTLKQDNEEKQAMITRLHSEAQTAERNHAMRTAMLATVEAQVEVLQHETTSKTQALQESIEKVSSLQVEIRNVEVRLQERIELFQRDEEVFKTTLKTEKEQHNLLIQGMKKEHEDAMDQQKREFQKKSSLARQLLSEREEEVRILSKKVAELQEEIQSGAPTDRKIFELASIQSKRDAFYDQHRDHREIAFLQLQNTLASRDLELAQVQQRVSELYHEVIELRKVKQREGINMDYLKNVVFQYMTFPSNSSEKLALVPVIAMLLQFSPKEMTEVQMSIRDPSFGTKSVKEVKRTDFSAFLALATSGGNVAPVNIIKSPIRPAATTPLNSPVPQATTRTTTVTGAANTNGGNSGYRPPTIPMVPQGKAEGIALMTEEERDSIERSPVSYPSGLRKDGLSMSDQELQQKLTKFGGDILDITMSGDDHDGLSIVSPKSSIDEGAHPGFVSSIL